MDFLFDIGRVLLDFNFEKSLNTLLSNNSHHSQNSHHSPNPQVPDPLLARLLARKDELETGRIDGAQYSHWAADILDCDPAGFITAFREIFTPITLMWDTVRRLKTEGHRLILFSNTNDLHCPWIFERFPEFALFDAAVLSYEVGSMKPDHQIYHHAITRFRLIPARTLYIDDLPENIATGQHLGFQCHQYNLQNHFNFMQWLQNQFHA